MPRPWDHPRACGEKTARRSTTSFFSGSPPRMRGKDWRKRRKEYQRRITPAYAGKSPSPCSSRQGSRDHPRVCGEKRRLLGPDLPGLGSPPRMRGKVNKDNAKIGFSGITPAYAGKRTAPPSAPHGYRDHPRVCGEKAAEQLRRALQLGSPPRMRGKEPAQAVPLKGGGITPAYAGKSAAATSPAGS